MIAVSFAMTAAAFDDRTKTETRRFWKDAHAMKFLPLTVFMGWTKDPRAGGMRMHPAMVVACYKERLGDMTEESFQAEGGTRYWPNRETYIKAMGGPDLVPWVLRFEHPTCFSCRFAGEASEGADGGLMLHCEHPDPSVRGRKDPDADHPWATVRYLPDSCDRWLTRFPKLPEAARACRPPAKAGGQ